MDAQCQSTVSSLDLSSPRCRSWSVFSAIIRAAHRTRRLVYALGVDGRHCAPIAAVRSSLGWCQWTHTRRQGRHLTGHACRRDARPFASSPSTGRRIGARAVNAHLRRGGSAAKESVPWRRRSGKCYRSLSGSRMPRMAPVAPRLRVAREARRGIVGRPMLMALVNGESINAAHTSRAGDSLTPCSALATG